MITHIKPLILKIDSIKAGNSQMGIAIDPVNHIAYVTNNDNIMISVIDTNTVDSIIEIFVLLFFVNNVSAIDINKNLLVYKITIRNSPANLRIRLQNNQNLFLILNLLRN
ncbi:MAG TPA: hypothetical protein VJ697_12510 [Nitrososphaeraceae archaeon]|nr:hypothetical protein [Nitrososphaeraceae archaeon]